MTSRPDHDATPIKWPALLVYTGEPELGVVADQAEWDLDPDLHARRYSPDDRLIDAVGVGYRVGPGSPADENRGALVANGERYTASDVQQLAERHLQAIGAQPDWLAAHLSDIPPASRIHATILYVARHERQRDSSPADDNDD